MKKTIERALPREYKQIEKIDYERKGISRILVNLATILPGLAMILVAAVHNNYRLLEIMAAVLIALLFILVYIPIHEGVHGLAFRIMTGEKPTYKMDIKTGTFVCYFKDLYVYAKAEIRCALAPFLSLSLILFAGYMFLFSGGNVLMLTCGIIMMFHIFCCRGDLILTKQIILQRDKNLLIKEEEGTPLFYKK